MRNPTEKQFDKVIANLEKAFVMAKGNAPVDMMNNKVYENICGTPMCHGGWYAVATIKKFGGLDYNEGAERIAKHLGFEDKRSLRNWAHSNPELWGNNYGNYMFCDGPAFNQNKDDGFTLQTIIDHWKGVRERTLAL